MRCSSATRSIDGPPAPRVDGHRRELGDRLVLVGLVGEAVHAVAPFGVVAHDAEEHHDRAAARRRGPGGGGVDREQGRGDGDPVAGRRAAARRHGSEGTARVALRPRRDLPEHPTWPTRNGQGPSVHSAPCPLRRPEATARPSPTTSRAARLRTPSTGPGCTPASCARSSATPRLPARSRGPREWAIAVGVRGRRRCSRPSLVLVAFGALGGRHRSPIAARPSSPTPATSSTTRSPSGSAPTVAPSVVTVQRRRRHHSVVGSGVVLKSDRDASPRPHLLTGATDGRISTPTGQQLPAEVGGHRRPDRPRRCSRSPTATSSWPARRARAAAGRPDGRRGQRHAGPALPRRHRRGVRPRRDGRRRHRHRRRRACSTTGITDHARTCPAARWSIADGNVVGILTTGRRRESPTASRSRSATCRDVDDQTRRQRQGGPRLARRALRRGRRPRPGRRRRDDRLVSPGARPRRGADRRRRGDPSRRSSRSSGRPDLVAAVRGLRTPGPAATSSTCVTAAPATLTRDARSAGDPQPLPCPRRPWADWHRRPCRGAAARP